MYEKTVTFMKISCKGKVFKCTQIRHCLTDDEKKKRRKVRQMERAEFEKRERERQRMQAEYKAERLLHHSSMNRIMDAYMEYLEMIEF
jgi:hypothetical protein